MKLIAELRDIPGVEVQPTEPATRENGDALELGDVWISTDDPPEVSIFDGTVWQPTAAREHTHVEVDITDLQHRQWIGPWTYENAGAP